MKVLLFWFWVNCSIYNIDIVVVLHMRCSISTLLSTRQGRVAEVLGATSTSSGSTEKLCWPQ